jgi:hypothetical protein
MRLPMVTRPNHEHTALDLITEIREPEKVERFGLSFSTLFAIFDRESAKPLVAVQPDPIALTVQQLNWMLAVSTSGVTVLARF